MSVDSKDPCDCNDLPQIPEFSFFTNIAKKLDIKLDSVDTLEEISFTPNPPPALSLENQYFINLGNKNGWGYNSFQGRYDEIRQYVSDRKKQREIESSIFTCFKENKPSFSDMVQQMITSKTEEDTKRFEQDDPWIGYKKQMIEILYGDVDMNCGKLNYVFNMRKYYQLCIDQVKREMNSLLGEENKNTKRALRILEEQKSNLSDDPKLHQTSMLSNALDEKTYGQVSLADAMKKDRTDMRKLDGYKELHKVFVKRKKDLAKYTTPVNASYVYNRCKPETAPGGGQAARPAAPIQPQTSGTGKSALFSGKGQIKALIKKYSSPGEPSTGAAGGGALPPRPRAAAANSMRGGNATTNSVTKILERNADYYITYSNLLLYLTSLNYYYLDKTAPNRKAQLNKFSSKIMSLIAPMKGGSKKNGTLKKKLKSLTKNKSVKHKSIPRQIGGTIDNMTTDNWVIFGYNNNNNGQINFGIVFENFNRDIGVLKFAPPNAATTTKKLLQSVNDIIQSSISTPPTIISNTSLIIKNSDPSTHPPYDLILRPRKSDYHFGYNMNKFISYLFCNKYIDKTNTSYTNSLLNEKQLTYLMSNNMLGQRQLLSTLNFVNGYNEYIRPKSGIFTNPLFGTLTFLTDFNPYNPSNDSNKYIHIDRDNVRSHFISLSALARSLSCKTTFKDLNKVTGDGSGGGGPAPAPGQALGEGAVPMDVDEASAHPAPVIPQTLKEQLQHLTQIQKSGKAPASEVEKQYEPIVAELQKQKTELEEEKRKACEIICKESLKAFNNSKALKCLRIIEEISTKLDNLESQQNNYDVDLDAFTRLRIDINEHDITILPANLLGLGIPDVSIIYENNCKQVEFVKNLFLFIEQCDNLNAVKPWRNNISKLILGFMKRVVYGETLGDMTGITIDKPGYNIFNLVLMGTPGVGKSYNANIIGKALFYSGLLAKGKLQVITSTDLIAGYIGQTKGQVAEKLAGALGDVFFLDEAYAIAGKPTQTGENKQYDKYGQEALDEITDFSSKNMGLLSFIVAGYEYEMQTQFLEVNQGLSRRFPTQIVLTRNSIKGLWNIVYSQMKQNFIGELYSPNNLKYHDACFQILNIFFNYQVQPNPDIIGSGLTSLWNILTRRTNGIFSSRIRFGNKNNTTQQIEPTDEYINFMTMDNLLKGIYAFPLKPPNDVHFNKITEQFLQSFILYKTGIQNNSKFPPNGDLFRGQSDTMIKMAGMILNDFQTGKGLGIAQQATTTPEQWADYIRYLYFDLFFKKNPAFPISIENISYQQNVGDGQYETNIFTIQSAYPDQPTMVRDILKEAVDTANKGKQRPPGTGTRGTDAWWFFSNNDFKTIYDDLIPLLPPTSTQTEAARVEEAPAEAEAARAAAAAAPEAAPVAAPQVAVAAEAAPPPMGGGKTKKRKQTRGKKPKKGRPTLRRRRRK